MNEGRARVDGNRKVGIITDGPCLEGTLEKLEFGATSPPMPREALSRIRQDALGLLGKVVDAYDNQVARGEVGASGTAQASGDAPLTRCPTGLLYGRVQSGKTVAMITFCAAAIDNGFRIVVVLTSDIVKLVEQTADRFGALDGPLIKNCLQIDSWSNDLEHIKRYVPQHGIIFICTKNQQRLSALVDFLTKIDAAGFPGLVLDDEADQATLDTTTQARASGKKGAESPKSAIHRKTVEDDEGESIRQTLRHHVFVQVTATPYALLLQNIENDLRPQFTHLIEPGVGYTGGESFFDVAHVQQEAPPLIFVADDESSVIEADTDSMPPIGLKKAIAFFLIAAGAQNIVDPKSRTTSQNFLCHTSQKTSEHSKAAQLIRNYLNQVSQDLETPASASETVMRLSWGYEELKKTAESTPPFEDIVDRIKKRIPRRDVPIVNSANSSVDLARELNFIVGGNILGRGITIDNLLVTYYLRRAKTSQMDTVLQHARMYGYRRALMPFTRVFLPEILAARFHFIFNAEQNLRRQLSTSTSGRITVETMKALRATRANVLDAQNLAAYEPGQHIYPISASFSLRDLGRYEEIRRDLATAFGGSLKENQFVRVEIQTLIELLARFPYPDDRGKANAWEPEPLTELLQRLESRGKAGYLYCRSMARTGSTLSTGAISGKELSEARSLSGPVFFAFYDDALMINEKGKNHRYWYPSLVLPSDMPTHVFNTTG